MLVPGAAAVVEFKGRPVELFPLQLVKTEMLVGWAINVSVLDRTRMIEVVFICMVTIEGSRPAETENETKVEFVCEAGTELGWTVGPSAVIGDDGIGVVGRVVALVEMLASGEGMAEPGVKVP